MVSGSNGTLGDRIAKISLDLYGLTKLAQSGTETLGKEAGQNIDTLRSTPKV